jgi:putative protease
LAAFQYGADAVYLGLSQFSARADADNLTPDRLRVLLAYARSFSPRKRVYVTVNTLVEDAELPQLIEILDALDDLGPDGVIVQDLGVARLIRDHFPRLVLHASTQMAVHNAAGASALRELGFSRVVLARELTFEEIRQIVRVSGVEVEIFVHGALCYSVSGLCLFSSHMTGRSGNRGRCAYCCREAFSTAAPRPPPPDLQTPPSASRPVYPFSMRDLALAPLLDEVVATGVQSLKIEGRMKSPLYVACVTDYYRRKLDGTLSPDAEQALIQDVQTVFSRPWTALYAQGADAPPATVIDPLAIGHRGARIGSAEAVTRDPDGIRWLRFTSSRALEKHDGVQVELASGGRPFGCAVNVLRAAGSARPAVTLPAGVPVEVALPNEEIPDIPRGAPIFCSASQAVRRRYAVHALRDADFDTGRPVAFRVTLRPGGITVQAETADTVSVAPVCAEAQIPLALSPSRQPDQTAGAVRKAFSRLGDTAWRFGTLELDDPSALYAPLSALNEARRLVVARLDALWNASRAARREAIAGAWGLKPVEPPSASPESSTTPSGAHATLAGEPSAHATVLTADSAMPTWTLKLRASPPPPSCEALHDFACIILAIGHTGYDALKRDLDAWRTLTGRARLRLALPPLTRMREWGPLTTTVDALLGDGWNEWECADLAGFRLLADRDQTPVSADWSLYALNRIALSELGRLGVRHVVLSPEISLAGLKALSLPRPSPSPAAEMLVYQHTPLFISETAPCLPPDADASRPDGLHLTDRRGRAFRLFHLDNRWITVAESAFYIAAHKQACAAHRYRVDLSWSPGTAWDMNRLIAIRNGQPLTGTHRAQFDRGFA